MTAVHVAAASSLQQQVIKSPIKYVADNTVPPSVHEARKSPTAPRRVGLTSRRCRSRSFGQPSGAESSVAASGDTPSQVPGAEGPKRATNGHMRAVAGLRASRTADLTAGTSRPSTVANITCCSSSSSSSSSTSSVNASNSVNTSSSPKGARHMHELTQSALWRYTASKTDIHPEQVDKLQHL
eukprot:TRINITY_DN3974_c0_g1_i1.p1 TRINITY_DN3974_c0_g1~~TRINITY_DN3974_c0_g1_i1.p1  ORF type:complete len:197 (-),score=20.35 TRINITY_DN3974_c0_g1_i1:1802-2350(-)